MPDVGQLLNKRFEKSGFGGYKAADVDAFMAELAASLRDTGHETAELKRKLGAAENRLKDYEEEQESLKNTLLNAQRLADKMTRDAQQRAEEIIRSAQIKSENLIDCALSEVEMRKTEAERIKKDVFDFKIAVMHLYKAQLELIRDIPAEDASESAAEPDMAENAEEPDLTIPEAAAPVIEQKPAPQPAQDKTAEQPLAQEEIKMPESPVQPSTPAEKRFSAVPQRMGKPEEPATPTLEPSVPEPEEQTMAEAAAVQVEAAPEVEPSVRLNLRFNEKTGEYEPIGQEPPQTSGDGLRFGAGYDLYTDSFGEDQDKRTQRRKN